MNLSSAFDTEYNTRENVRHITNAQQFKKIDKTNGVKPLEEKLTVPTGVRGNTVHRK